MKLKEWDINLLSLSFSFSLVSLLEAPARYFLYPGAVPPFDALEQMEHVRPRQPKQKIPVRPEPEPWTDSFLF